MLNTYNKFFIILATWAVAQAGLLSMPPDLGFPVYWPLSGLMLSLFLRYGTQSLPYIFLGIVFGFYRHITAPDLLYLFMELVWYAVAAVSLRKQIGSMASVKSVLYFILCSFCIGVGTSALAILFKQAQVDDSVLITLHANRFFFLSKITGLLSVTPAALLLLKKKQKFLVSKMTYQRIAFISFELLIVIFQIIVADSDIFLSAMAISLLIPVTIWACLYLEFSWICALIFLSAGITAIGAFNGRNGMNVSTNYLLFIQLQIYVRTFSLLLFGTLRNERDLENRRLQVSQNATLVSLANLAETRDNETGQHILRTQKYVHMLAKYLSRIDGYGKFLSSEAIETIYRSAPLHDIGKVGIADRILLKPERLTPEEFDLMKKHTEIGRNALQKTLDMVGADPFLKMAQTIAHLHHEKWDGTGYPLGLRGEEIPLAARIMALADVYDALTSERIYKQAYSHEKAREIIISESGKHFDPAVVDAFLALDRKFQAVSRKGDEELPLTNKWPGAIQPAFSPAPIMSKNPNNLKRQI